MRILITTTLETLRISPIVWGAQQQFTRPGIITPCRVLGASVDRPLSVTSADTPLETMGKRKRADALLGGTGMRAIEEECAFFCPACNQRVVKWPVYSRHLQRCCPDLLQGKDMLRNADMAHTAKGLAEGFRQAIAAAASEEEGLRQQCVRLPLMCQANCPSQGLACGMQDKYDRIGISSLLLEHARDR